MQLLRPEDFDPWVGRKIRVSTVPSAVEVMLDRVERRPALRFGDLREPFSLFFQSPMDVYLLDATYRFDCGKGGPHDLYISQLMPMGGCRRYQAVFS